VTSFLNSSNLFVITVVPVMQVGGDLERNETESRVDHVSGHVEDPGDQAAGPLHAQYGSLYFVLSSSYGCCIFFVKLSL
jgi:hypothetical protein